MENKKLADDIARYIFEVGGDPDRNTIRIQFMGLWRRPGGLEQEEVGMGGLCESSLSSAVLDVLMRKSVIKGN